MDSCFVCILKRNKLNSPKMRRKKKTFFGQLIVSVREGKCQEEGRMALFAQDKFQILQRNVRWQERFYWILSPFLSRGSRPLMWGLKPKGIKRHWVYQVTKAVTTRDHGGLGGFQVEIIFSRIWRLEVFGLQTAIFSLGHLSRGLPSRCLCPNSPLL